MLMGVCLRRFCLNNNVHLFVLSLARLRRVIMHWNGVH